MQGGNVFHFVTDGFEAAHRRASRVVSHPGPLTSATAYPADPKRFRDIDNSDSGLPLRRDTPGRGALMGRIWRRWGAEGILMRSMCPISPRRAGVSENHASTAGRRSRGLAGRAAAPVVVGGTFSGGD